MKKLLMVLMAIGFAVNTYAQTSTQQDTLPLAIRTDFSGKFATASAIAWTLADSIYTGTFTFDGKRHIIEYTPAGKIQMHRFELNENQYPASILATIKKNFPSYKIEDIDYIESSGVITYEAELEGKPDYIVVFDASGKVLSSKKE